MRYCKDCKAELYDDEDTFCINCLPDFNCQKKQNNEMGIMLEHIQDGKIIQFNRGEIYFKIQKNNERIVLSSWNVPKKGPMSFPKEIRSAITENEILSLIAYGLLEINCPFWANF